MICNECNNILYSKYEFDNTLCNDCLNESYTLLYRIRNHNANKILTDEFISDNFTELTSHESFKSVNKSIINERVYTFIMNNTFKAPLNKLGLFTYNQLCDLHEGQFIDITDNLDYLTNDMLLFINNHNIIIRSTYNIVYDINYQLLLKYVKNNNLEHNLVRNYIGIPWRSNNLFSRINDDVVSFYLSVIQLEENHDALYLDQWYSRVDIKYSILLHNYIEKNIIKLLSYEFKPAIYCCIIDMMPNIKLNKKYKLKLSYYEKLHHSQSYHISLLEMFYNNDILTVTDFIDMFKYLYGCSRKSQYSLLEFGCSNLELPDDFINNINKTDLKLMSLIVTKTTINCADIIYERLQYRLTKIHDVSFYDNYSELLVEYLIDNNKITEVPTNEDDVFYKIREIIADKLKYKSRIRNKSARK